MESLSDYDYDLPAELIAQHPLEVRSSSKLLRINRETKAIEHERFADCVKFFREGDLLVLNDTRVSARRLVGRRVTGGATELLLLKSIAENTYEALAKPVKKLKANMQIYFESELTATVVEVKQDGIVLVTLESSGDLEQVVQESSTIPLPPYITEVPSDENRYQTVFAATDGSSAAPTAGLHFDSETLAELAHHGVQIATVTLDVGLDTFRPVTCEKIEAHTMHGESCTVSEEVAELVNSCKGKIIAVGTTTVRTLETFAIGKRHIQPGSMSTSIFIRPGYRFQVIDGMFTNFHLPRTTMLMMVSALIGRETLLGAYAEAIKKRYRFLSFGDSMLII